MTDAAFALQSAIVTALKTVPDLTAYLGGESAASPSRVYDAVPATARFPYVSIGPAQVNRQDATCILGREVFQQVDVWSREPGFTQAKRIGGLIEDALHNLEASSGGLRFDIEHRFTSYLRDGDGLTSHGALSFRAEIYEFNE